MSHASWVVLFLAGGALVTVVCNWLRESAARDRARRRDSKQCPVCGQEKEGHR